MNISKLLPKKAQDIKGAVAIAELKRAHYIIAILSVAFAATVTSVSALELQFDGVLSAIASALLVVLAIVSLGTAIMLGKR